MLQIQKNVSSMFVTTHQSVALVSERMKLEVRRHNYVTPTNYLDLVTGYKRWVPSNFHLLLIAYWFCFQTTFKFFVCVVRAHTRCSCYRLFAVLCAPEHRINYNKQKNNSNHICGLMVLFVLCLCSACVYNQSVSHYILITCASVHPGY